MAKSPKEEATRSLNKILKLFANDIRILEKIAKGQTPQWKQLDEQNYKKLVDYASVLSRVIKESGKEKADAKKDLSKLSTQELVKMLDGDKKPAKKKDEPKQEEPKKEETPKETQQ
jgi:hypothetical protein